MQNTKEFFNFIDSEVKIMESLLVKKRPVGL